MFDDMNPAEKATLLEARVLSQEAERLRRDAEAARRIAKTRRLDLDEFLSQFQCFNAGRDV